MKKHIKSIILSIIILSFSSVTYASDLNMSTKISRTQLQSMATKAGGVSNIFASNISTSNTFNYTVGAIAGLLSSSFYGSAVYVGIFIALEDNSKNIYMSMLQEMKTHGYKYLKIYTGYTFMSYDETTGYKNYKPTALDFRYSN
jgi:hypothetical protein